MHPLVEKKRLLDAIAADPCDPENRLALAKWHRSRGNFRAEALQYRKAGQCRRGINPDFDYTSRLEVYDLFVVLYAGGEVAKLVDGPYEYWADPVELQGYLATVPAELWNAADMPLGEHGVPSAVLRLLADDIEVPGTYYKLPDEWLIECPHDRLKLLEGGSWLLLPWQNEPEFVTPEEAVAYGFDRDILESVSM